ncbi:hypothetical protein BY458DRAFT_528538 [Sporodiniella umbellata]|nr:hypothetical protein BY458DRAFT_528538 [Sporodiniella umbellata]
MMKLFKKKKSEPRLSPRATLNESILGETSVSIASEGPPTLVMPKPRRVMTPTRAILAGFEGDKTEVEESEEDKIHAVSTLDSQTASSSSSRPYHSALESLSELSTALDETQVENPTPPMRLNPIERIKPTLIPPEPPLRPTDTRTDEILKELKDKVVQMEKQQAIDRAEWQRKEQGLVENHQKMIQKLLETEHQLNEARKKKQPKWQKRSKSEERLSRRDSSSSSSHQSPSVTLVTATRPRAKSIDQKETMYYGHYPPRPRKSHSSSSKRTMATTPCSTPYYEDELEGQPPYPPTRYYPQYRAYPYSYQHYPVVYPSTRKYVQRYPVYYDYP